MKNNYTRKIIDVAMTNEGSVLKVSQVWGVHKATVYKWLNNNVEMGLELAIGMIKHYDIDVKEL